MSKYTETAVNAYAYVCAHNIIEIIINIINLQPMCFILAPFYSSIENLNAVIIFLDIVYYIFGYCLLYYIIFLDIVYYISGY